MCSFRFSVSTRSLLKTKRIVMICRTAARVSTLDSRILGVTVMMIERRNRGLLMMMMMGMQ